MDVNLSNTKSKIEINLLHANMSLGKGEYMAFFKVAAHLQN